MEQIVTILGVIAGILAFIALALAGIYLTMQLKGKSKKTEEEIIKDSRSVDAYKNPTNLLPKETIYSFMEFDEIKDNMIIRKDGAQHVMVIQCQGVNYDLMSEQEKIAVEEGFVQFLNTLRFPIQLYIQTRSLNLRDIVEEYKVKVRQIETEINNLNVKAQEAKSKGNEEVKEKIEYQIRRKKNVLEYGLDITDYIGKLSSNQNVLQQKTYIVVSYFTAELGSTSTYSKEEIDNMCFSELYTRCQSVARSLSTSEVSGRILNSEELTELLYVAYNREGSEVLPLSKVLDAEYDSLYSTGKDVLEKKQQLIDEELDADAVDLVTESIIEANRNKLTESQKVEKIKEKALDVVEQYKDQMDKELYEGTKKEIVKKSNTRKVKATKSQED